MKRPADRQLLPRSLVPVLQHGPAGDPGCAAGPPATRRPARRDLAADGSQTAADRSAKTRSDFPILSDPHSDVAAAFGLRFKQPDYLIELYKNVYKNDLEVVNGDPSWTLPMPARFLIGQDGTILYAEVDPDYTRRPDPEAILPVMAKVAPETAA